ncbi:hypothetical protein DH2020_045778 [Rehmannia glutinosa]|uniref:Uncharacterized protein n=1 Tax=Rehmannia glutinosa TaxID=99300 RepID=A0ABR0UD86_REHGL
MMFYVKTKPSSFLIQTTLILVLFSFFSLPGAADAAENGVVSLGTRRSVLEGSNGGNSTTLVLAKDRTRRKDPLDDLKYYNGGWNISNEHYIACLVYILVIFGWILVAITFILCGIFLVLHNVMGDTCVAMNEWVVNPTAHTALDDIIPCVDPATAQEALSQSKEVTLQMVQLVNGIIANVSNANLPPNAGPFYYNQSGPLVPLLCNPYNPDKTDRRICTTGEVDLNNATQVWRNYECQVSGSNICTTVGRLTPSLYDQMSGAVNVSYGLHHYGPFLTGLVDCTFVRDTFTTIHDRHCPDLRKYSQWVYIGLVMVSAAVMLSLILWVLYARERRHRKYTKLVDANSAQTSFASKGP